MGKTITVPACLTLLCLVPRCLTLAASAEDSRWITFKTTHNGWGKLEHQIDRASIHQEGPYKIFWTRIWIDSKKQPMVFSCNESVVFLSQEFAVDCAGRRYGPDFIDSNDPLEKKLSAKLQTMRWQTLDKLPAMGRALCGDR